MLEDYSKAREHFPAFQAQLEVLAADDEGIWEPIRLEYERLKLSPQQYNCVIGLMACLHPFAEIVPHLGGNLYTTAAATIPMIFVARSEVAEVEAPQASSGEVRQIIQAFKAELLKQLDFKTEAAYKTESYLAAALDPRFKSLDFLKYNPKNADQSIYNAVKALRNELIRMEYDAQYEAAKKKLEEAAAAAAAAAGPAAEPAPAPAPQEGRVVSSLERKLAGVTGAGAAGPARGGGPLPPAAPGNTLEPQLKSYLTEIAEWDALVALSWGQDPLVWFRKHMLDFPYVSALYRRYGSCPGSSTYSERVWSHAGQIVVENRASLNDDSIAALVNLYELYLAGVPIFELAGQIKKAVGRPEGSPDGKKRKST